MCGNGTKPQPLTFERVAAEQRKREAERAEVIRQERHHEVLCIALKELLRMPGRSLSQAAHEARLTADYVYPPPPEKT